MKVELVVHTTCGIELELIEEGTGKVVMPRSYVCEEGEEDAEANAKIRVRRLCEKKGYEVVREVWS